jgi:hypothetical protein
VAPQLREAAGRLSVVGLRLVIWALRGGLGAAHRPAVRD